MSSYSFSHQFYQRWTCAPDSIRTSIIQELTDITTLLKAETPFETFVFSTHDLDAHLDDLYENHEAEQAIAKAIADKQAAEQAIAEQKRLEEIKAEDAKRKEEAKLREEALKEENKREQDENTQKEAEKETRLAANTNHLEATIKPETSATNKTNTDNSVHAVINNDSDTQKNTVGSKTISEHAHAIVDESINNDKTIKSDNSINAINNKASAAISLAVKDAKLSATHKELIHELEMQIDDYLSDQMMLMSENLKSWLRAEMTQHLSEQDKPSSNDNLPKN